MSSDPAVPATAPAGPAVPTPSTTVLHPCRDFIHETNGQLWLWGTVPILGSLEYYINGLGWNQLATPNTNYMCALYALEISLNSAYTLYHPGRRVPSFDELLAIYRSDEYKRCVEDRLAGILDGSPSADALYNAEFSELNRENDLSVSALPIILELLGYQEDIIFALGVCTRKEDTEAGEVYSVARYVSQPHNPSTLDLWIVNDGADRLAEQQDLEEQGLEILNHFSGIGPDPGSAGTSRQPEASEEESESSEEEAPESSEEEEPAGKMIPRKRKRGQEIEDEDDYEDHDGDEDEDRDEDSPNKGSTNDERVREYRTNIADAPSRDTELPYGELTDCTIEELVTYYPDHVFSWPGLALLVHQTDLGGFSGIERLVNTVRRTESKKREGKSVLANSIRKRMERAIRELLGQDYKMDREQHNECLRTRLARDNLTLKGFLNQHLWDKPRRLAGKMRPAVPLSEVARFIAGRSPHSNFSRRLRDAQAGHYTVLPPLALVSGQIHPLVVAVPDIPTSQDPNDPAAAALMNIELDRDVFPVDMEPEDVVTYKPDSMYGEPLLFAYRKLELARMAKMLGGTGKGGCKILNRLKQRKKFALETRAKRDGVTYKQAFDDFEKERAQAGFKHSARRLRTDKSKKKNDATDVDRSADHANVSADTTSAETSVPARISSASIPATTTRNLSNVDAAGFAQPTNNDLVNQLGRTVHVPASHTGHIQITQPTEQPVEEDGDVPVDPALEEYQWTSSS